MWEGANVPSITPECSPTHAKLTDEPTKQVALLLTACYLSYAIAEAFELSGTLTLLFAALTLGR